MLPAPPRRALFVYLGYFLLHVGFHGAARLFEISPGISLWYPPVGLAVALATMYGWRAAPVILAANLSSGLMSDFDQAPWLQFGLPVLITAIYTGAGKVLRHYYGPIPRPMKPLATGFVMLLFLMAPAVAASAGTLAVHAAGVLAPGAGWASILNWWIGDFTGVITVVPLCLVHVAPRLLEPGRTPQAKWAWRRVATVAGEAALLLGCVWLVSGLDAVRDYRAYYFCFIPLALICLRHGLPGATIATCVLTMSSLMAVRFYGGSTDLVPDVTLFVLCVSGVGLGLGWSVTRRTYAEAERARLLEILEATTDFVGTCDPQGRITYLNSAYLKVRGVDGLEALRGTSAREAYPGWAADKIFNEAVPMAIRDGVWHGETALLDQHGEEIPISQVIVAHFGPDRQPILISTVCRDIREQKKAERVRLEAERNLLQAQKLESLGVLAGGIAHDFNNLLTVMLGNATLARLDLPANGPAEKAVHQIELAALRASELCRHMLAYSGKSRLTLGRVDLTSVVEQTMHLLKVSVAKTCALELELARDLPPVQGDATQLSQVAMNLVMNASDASSEAGGRIRVRTGLIEADRAYLASTYLPVNAEPGSYAYVEVSDQGCGMTPEVLHRLFEPFFTTKFTGHGLGLSAVLGIVRSHRGTLTVESEPGRGTTFRVLFPTARGAVAAPKESVAIERWLGSGLVLVADDEESVRDIACRVLGRFGFETVAALDGRDAVEVFRRNPGGFRAVLMDLSMPVMNGREACREINRINPAVPVLLMSGYNRTRSADPAADEAFAGFIQKPFEAATLALMLRRVLDGGPVPADRGPAGTGATTDSASVQDAA